MNLKVLFTTYFTAFQNPGGGEIVLLKTREALQKQGLTVDLFDQWNTKINHYDIVHDFSLHSWRNWSAFKTYGPKLAVTPVTWPHIHFPYPQKEQLKYLIETFLRRNSPETSFREALKLPDIFFPTTEIELKRIQQRYPMTRDSRFQVIPNGISSPPLLADTPNHFIQEYKIHDYLLYVGRITPVKNIEFIIEAAKKMNKNLFIIGDANNDEVSYFNKLKTMSNQYIHFIPSLPHGSQQLLDAYRGAKALIVASYFETCSLVGMEAASLGTPVIMTEEGATKEIYKEHVIYVSPSNQQSLLEAIEKASTLTKNDKLRDHIVQNYTWDKIASRLVAAYQGILS